ncbi:MAG: hypothetical protein IKD71_00785 [Solobacterium sp.]|nr:hypothetical protein [Solobacterium sp.]
MANVLSVIISVLFAGILVYMLGIYFKNRKYIIIKGKNMTRYRMLMLSALMFSLVTLVAAETMYDTVRSILMTLALSAVILVRDGIGEEGIVYNYRRLPFYGISRYDYYESRSAFVVVFQLVGEDKNKQTSTINIEMLFELRDGERVRKLLVEKLPKKHMRMKTTS